MSMVGTVPDWGYNVNMNHNFNQDELEAVSGVWENPIYYVQEYTPDQHINT